MDPISTSELVKLVETAISAAKKAENGDPAERERAVDVLKILVKSQVTMKALAETQAGKRIRALSKHSEPRIASAATETIASWKHGVSKESGSQKPSSGVTFGSTSMARSPSLGTVNNGATAAAQESQPPSGTKAHPPPQQQEQHGAVEGHVPVTDPSSQAASAIRSQQGDEAEVHIPFTGDNVRDKCRLNFVKALQQAVTEGIEVGNPVSMGVAIETALHMASNGVTAGYKTKFRQLHFNLKDEKNPDLRRKVLDGTFSPELLISLSPEELASDAKREENQKIREKKLFDSAPSAAKQATTDQFQCGKCRQRKTTYYQMQTRSADEPMTTFVTCLNCNNRWKFC